MKHIEDQVLEIMRRPVVHYGAVILDELEPLNKDFTRTQLKDIVLDMLRRDVLRLGKELRLEINDVERD